MSQIGLRRLRITRSPKDASSEGTCWRRGECGARGWGHTPRSRAAWASACRHYDRRVRCITGLGQARGGRNSRFNCARSPRPGWRGLTGSSAPAESQEAWPELSLGMMSPSCESRGGTPTGELPPPIPSPASGEGKGGGSAASDGAAVVDPRLSAFRFLFLLAWHSFLKIGETGVANREITRHHPSISF